MLLAFYHLQNIIPSAGIEKTVLDIGTGLLKDCLNQSKTLKQYEEDSKYHCYESPRKERVSCIFEHLIFNIKLYNKNKDINSMGD